MDILVYLLMGLASIMGSTDADLLLAGAAFGVLFIALIILLGQAKPEWYFDPEESEYLAKAKSMANEKGMGRKT